MISYINWLKTYGINQNYDKHNNYNLLFKKLHATPFVSLVDFDGNRIYEALEIRAEYLRMVRDDRDAVVEETDQCSMLELIISLAIRAESMTYDSPERLTVYEWFWRLLDNLAISYMDDDNFDSRKCDAILFNFIDRKYKRNGEGGIFPVSRTKKDQRKVELWYQLADYIEENFS